MSHVMVRATESGVTLDPADVRVVVDKMGREAVIIPDMVATALNQRIRRGWTELHNIADGYSRMFPEGHWAYRVVTVLLGVYLASDVPTFGEFDARDRERMIRTARGHRDWAAGDRSYLILPIVGAGDWDDTERFWVDMAANRLLHMDGYPHFDHCNKFDTGEITGEPNGLKVGDRYMQFRG